MTQPILFIQGGGDDGYETDKALVGSLQQHLGADYEINYPKLPSDESAPDFGWIAQIHQLMVQGQPGTIAVAHSLGASMLLKYLSGNHQGSTIKALFLLATPYWSGDEDWKKGLQLQENFADKLPENLPIFFYHCKDDAVAPFAHLAYYQQKIPQATFREWENGGHQFNNDLSPVARDIKSLRLPPHKSKINIK